MQSKTARISRCAARLLHDLDLLPPRLGLPRRDYRISSRFFDALLRLTAVLARGVLAIL